MVTKREFCRFARVAPDQAAKAVYTTEIPEGGMCLSSFLVIAEGDKVLMGHLNPGARWDQIGALDASRANIHSKGWMLPSSHLMLYESPQEAARRILDEQLGMGGMELSDPIVTAEVGTPRRYPSAGRHWDFEFIFRGKAPKGWNPKHEAWRELRYLDLERTSRKDIARLHDDVLVNAGFRF